MAYDEDLANRVRELIDLGPRVREQSMFGGMAFLVDGNMALAVSRQGGLLVRVDPAQTDRLAASAGVEVAVMGGRRMQGWLRVPPEKLQTKRQLSTWVKRSFDHASSLPAKKKTRSSPRSTRRR